MLGLLISIGTAGHNIKMKGSQRPPLLIPFSLPIDPNGMVDDDDVDIEWKWIETVQAAVQAITRSHTRIRFFFLVKAVHHQNEEYFLSSSHQP
jgi:hypothetical protein